MNPKWIIVLIVGPLIVIGVATFIIVRPNPVETMVQSIKSVSPVNKPPATTVEPIAPKLSPPSRVMAPATVMGGAWLSRNNGASDVLRSLHVYIIQKTVPAESVRRVLTIQWKQEKEDSAEEEKDAAQDDKYASRDEIALSVYGPSAKEHREKASAHRRTADSIAKTANALVDDEDVIKAWHFCKGIAPIAAFSDCAHSRIVMEGKTGIDGKYKIVNVPGGDYYLYANINTPTLSAEWIIPITIDGTPVSMDLDNDSAIRISGG